MRPEGPFIAARALARHSSALLRRSTPTRRPGADVLAAALGERLAAAMGKALTPFLAGAIPAVSCGEARIGPCDGPGASPAIAFGFAAGAETPQIGASIDQRVLAGLVERCFGGSGHDPHGAIGPLTPATALLARRIAARLAEVLGSALGGAPLEAGRPSAAIAIPGRTAQFELAIAENGRSPWHIRFALSCDVLDAGSVPTDPPGPSAPRAGDPTASPWADIALPVRAVLVDMAVPLGSVAALAPGQIIAVSVARRVPLRVAGQVVGRGDIGVFDDRAALRLTNSP